jgi:hypothetical protein
MLPRRVLSVDLWAPLLPVASLRSLCSMSGFVAAADAASDINYRQVGRAVRGQVAKGERHSPPFPSLWRSLC